MTCAFSFCFGQADKLPASSLTCQIIAEGTNLTLTGQPDGVMATRTEILNLYPTKVRQEAKKKILQWINIAFVDSSQLEDP